MDIEFYKYQGTGNDFVMIDHRVQKIPLEDREIHIEKMCDRRFGIGADGLILIEDHDILDFEMLYFNADGFSSSLCGNGGRCTAHFAHFIGLAQKEMRFQAFDGPHNAVLLSNGWVSLQMNNVEKVQKKEDLVYQLDTGSPHYISFVSDLEKIDVVKNGRTIRYSDEYREVGINVNFVERLSANQLKVHTYERGVEDETLACGTGVTAAAIALIEETNTPLEAVEIFAKGGPLRVKLNRRQNAYQNIWLEGPVGQVFKGRYSF